MPLAGGFAITMEQAEDAIRYPLTWARCRRCGLVNVTPDIADATLYAQYRYAASSVPALVRHHADFAKHIIPHHGARARLLEIGCNDGVLLRHLPKSWDLVGVDPSDIARQAEDRTWALVNVPFTADIGRALGKFDAITSSNSLAHFTRLDSAIEGIAQALKPHGRAYIEVHDLDATLASGQWDTIYHEHKVEWSVDSLSVAFARYGLRMVSAVRLPLHGGLIRAEFVKASPSVTDPYPAPDFGPLQTAYNDRRGSDAYRVMSEGGAAYGAAGRASVYLNQIPELPLAFVVDGSPQRAGRYMPGTGLAIVPPDIFETHRPRRTLITAWNHAPDIMARHPDYHGWVSAW